jgi:acyl-CoA thioester hydrolase
MLQYRIEKSTRKELTNMPQIRVPIRVPFPDVDSSGRIHFTAMMRYMEVAEHELMRALGFPYAETLHTLAFPRVHVSCDYRAAVRYDDLLTVHARVEHVSRSSWTVAFTIHIQTTDGGDGEIVAEGRMTIVSLNLQTERAQPLPEKLRAVLADAG